MAHRIPGKASTAPCLRRRRACFALAGSLLLCAFGTTLLLPFAAAAPGYRVVVHPQNPADRASRSFVADVFLKKATRWADDSSIRPVDQRASAGARIAFSNGVLGRSVSAVKSYWQQRIFSGRDVPPPEVEDDDAVVAYVSQNSGAIGYVSAAAKLKGVKAISLE